MPHVKIYLKGWRDEALFCAAVNDASHPLHEAAMPVQYASFAPYRPGDAVYFAVCYHDEGDDADVCEAAFERFNVGDPESDPVVARYRGAGHRSLSVGDVVVVDDRAYTVASFGFATVEAFEPREGSR